MMTVLSPHRENFAAIKCGEVYYVNSIYNVNCCICGGILLLNEFPKHFHDLHLSFMNETAKNYSQTKSPLEEEPQIDMISDTYLSDAASKVDESSSEVATKFEDRDLPIEFMEVRLPKLTGNKAENFIPEHVMDCSSIPTTTSSVSQEDTFDTPEITPNSRRKVGAKDIETLRLTRAILSNNHGMKTQNTKGGHRNVLDFNGQMRSEVKKSANIRLQCNLCQRSYKSNSGLQHHIRVAHEENSELTDEKTRSNLNLDKDESVDKPIAIQCNTCGKSFSCLGNLNTHKKRHTGIKSHKCQDCEKVFYTDHELQSHLMIHSDMLPVICEICGRRFRNTGKLKAHMRRHTGERPAKCEICGKCFFSNHDLNVHRITHTSERPFACEVCGSTFRTKKALRVHKKLHISEREYQCKLCNKAFVQLSGLDSHMSQVHMKSYTFKLIA